MAWTRQRAPESEGLERDRRVSVAGALLAASIPLFLFAPHVAELTFLASVLAAALGGPDLDSRERQRALVIHFAFVASASAWLIVRAHPVWAVDGHTLTHPMVYPVDLLDFLPYLWGFLFLSWRRWSRSEISLLLWVLVVTVPWWAVLGFGEVYLGWRGVVRWPPAEMTLVEFGAYPTTRWRASGGHGNGNLLAISVLYSLIAAMVLLAVGHHSKARGVWRRVSLTLALCLSLWALVQSGSRTAWIVGLLVLGVAGAVAIPRRLRIAAGVAAVLGLGLVVVSVRDLGQATQVARKVVPDVIWGRITDHDGSGTSSLDWRRRVWNCAAELVQERPLVGWRLGGFAPECERRIGKGANHAHNLPLQLASELGVPFAAAFLGWLAWILAVGLRRLGAVDSGDRLLTGALLTNVLAVLLISQSNLALLHDHRIEVVFWASLALLAAPRQEEVPADSATAP